MHKKILVGLDGSTHGLAATREAVEQAKASDAELHLLPLTRHVASDCAASRRERKPVRATLREPTGCEQPEAASAARDEDGISFKCRHINRGLSCGQ